MWNALYAMLFYQNHQAANQKCLPSSFKNSNEVFFIVNHENHRVILCLKILRILVKYSGIPNRTSKLYAIWGHSVFWRQVNNAQSCVTDVSASLSGVMRYSIRSLMHVTRDIAIFVYHSSVLKSSKMIWNPKSFFRTI